MSLKSFDVLVLYILDYYYYIIIVTIFFIPSQC